MANARNRRTNNLHVGTLVESLVLECRNPAQLLELYYWSNEPGLLPIIRGIAALPGETRARLEAFLHTSDPKSVTAANETGGQIRLTTSDARLAAKTLPHRRPHAA